MTDRNLDMFRDQFATELVEFEVPESYKEWDDDEIMYSAMRFMSERSLRIEQSWGKYPRPTPQGALDAQEQVDSRARYIMKLWEGWSECPERRPCRVDSCRQIDQEKAVDLAIQALCWR